MDEGAHGPGFPGPGGALGHVQAAAGGGEAADRGGLPGIQRGAGGGQAGQHPVQEVGRDGQAGVPAGGLQELPFGGEQVGGGVEGGAVAGVDAGLIDAPT